MSKKSGVVKFVFNYPYDLGLTDGSYYHVALSNDDKALVCISRINGTEAFNESTRRDSFDISSDTQHRDINIFKGKTECGGFFDLSSNEDNRKISYSWFCVKVELMFYMDDIFCYSDSDCAKTLINKRDQFFQKFLSVYRHISEDTANRHTNDYPYIFLYISESSLVPVEKFNDLEYIPYPMSGDKVLYPLIGGGYRSFVRTDVRKKEISDVRLRDFKNHLLQSEDVAGYRKMFLRGMQQISLGSDYTLAVLHYDTAIEMCVTHFLQIILQMNGKSKKYIDDLLLTDLDKLSKEQKSRAGGYRSSGGRMGKMIQLLNVEQSEFYQSAKYKNYKKDVRGVRNFIAHYGCDASLIKAEQAHKSAIEFMLYIERLNGISYNN